MNKFAYKIAQFMMGRRGFDQFSKDLIIFALVLLILDFLVPGNYLETFASFVLIYSYFRAFSKNLGKRQEENNWYMAGIGGKVRVLNQRDYKHYRYFKCPSCKQVLRAPKGKGKIRVTCSRCHSIFEKKV